MSLGKKLANYRKLAGLTQQQLGEELNLSPQAISKWENDLAEPDLATLRQLSELYKVPIAEMIDLTIPVSAPVQDEPQEEDVQEPKPDIIGFCKTCGIAVNSENLGEKAPVITCKVCKLKREEKLKRDKQEAEAAAQRAKRENIARQTAKRTTSLVVASIVTVIFAIIMIAIIINTKNYALIAVLVVGAYAVFSLVACLFYDCFVQEVLLDWTSKTFQFPGLIFTFDIEGCLWVIGMKLLFWIIGLALAAACAAIGITIGLVCAPFSFPFIMADMNSAIASGTKSKYMEY